MRHYDQKTGHEVIYTSNKSYFISLRSGPPGPGQKFSTYYVEIIQDWYYLTSHNSRCKIKAVPNYGQGGVGDVQNSVDDTIHLDIITVGYDKRVRGDF